MNSLIYLAINFFVSIGQNIYFILIGQENLYFVQDTEPGRGKKTFKTLSFIYQLSSGFEINSLLNIMLQAGVHMVNL